MKIISSARSTTIFKKQGTFLAFVMLFFNIDKILYLEFSYKLAYTTFSNLLSSVSAATEQCGDMTKKQNLIGQS